MLSGVGIICFAASYAVTLVLEVSRLFFRSGVRGAVMVGFAGAGLLAHSLYLYHRASDAGASFLSSRQDWCLLAAWGLAVAYLGLVWHHPKTSFGVFVLPWVLGLIGAGVLLADRAPFARESTSQWLRAIHGTSILLATVAVLVGFASGLMYLQQAYRLKRKRPPQRGLRLPSLEWLHRTNGRAMGVALLMTGAAIVSGILLNRVNHAARADAVAWNDPVVLSTVVMFGWLALSVGIGRFYRPAREGRRVALLTVLSFALLVVALATVLFLDTSHVRPERRGGGPLGRCNVATRCFALDQSERGLPCCCGAICRSDGRGGPA